MANDSKSDAAPWDEPDWIADKSRRGGQQPRGIPWVAIGMVLGVVLLAGTFVAVRMAREQATQEAMRAEMAALAEAERAAEARAEQERHAGLEKLRQVQETGTDGMKVIPNPAEAMQLMAADAKALANLGMFHLELNEFDEAIAAFRKAAELDPCYVEHVKMALKRQEQFDRTAPPPREVVKP